MLKHINIYKNICNKFWLKYRHWKWWLEPKNYTYFSNNKNQELFFIEKIPATKTRVKTIYLWIIKLNTNELEKRKIEYYIHNLYINSRDTKKLGCEWNFYSINYNTLF